jgi:IMP cyclohydrolase
VWWLFLVVNTKKRIAIEKEDYMYVGRIVAIGNTKDNKLVVMYRVSSRSFPNRQTKRIGKALAIVPKEGFEKDIYKNPYISYNCLRVTGNYAVVANGTHTDPIAEKLEGGMSMRDAMITVLHGMDYEHDSYNTPRITAAVDLENRLGALGIVRHDAFLVKYFTLREGEAFYVATYEHNSPSEQFTDSNFHISSVHEACYYILGRGVFANLERPISAACALEDHGGFSIGFKDMDDKIGD